MSKLDDLAELKKNLKEKKEKKENRGGNDNFYPFWQMEDGAEVILRPLPIKNQKTKAAFPFVEKLEHTLSIGGQDKRIPCLRMYGENYPICDLSSSFYKAKDEDRGKYYWRNKSLLTDVYIVQDALPAKDDGSTNEGERKITQFSNTIAKKYEVQLDALVTRGEIEALPWDLEDGTNFIIKKVKDGKWSNFDKNSEFARRPTSLPADFLETFEPRDLTDFLPKNPGLEKVMRMLEAHQSGDDYVDEDAHSNDSSEKEEAPASSLKSLLDKSEKRKSIEKEDSAQAEQEQEEIPVKESVKETVKAAKQPEPTVDDDDAETSSFLAEIRNRQKASAASAE